MRLLFLVSAFIISTAAVARSSEELPVPQNQPRQGESVSAYKPKPVSRGELLYTNHCGACHDSLVHIRKRQKAASREEIYTWVVRWSEELKLQWNRIDIEDVVKHLNQRYYHYPK